MIEWQNVGNQRLMFSAIEPPWQPPDAYPGIRQALCLPCLALQKRATAARWFHGVQMALHGQIHWTELMTRDAAKAREFYAGTVGWTFVNMPMEGQDYWVCFADGTAVAGIREIGDHGFDCAPELWMTFIAISDVDAAVVAAEERGALIIVAPQTIEGIGRIALLKDNGEAAVGFIAPA